VRAAGDAHLPLRSSPGWSFWTWSRRPYPLGHPERGPQASPLGHPERSAPSGARSRRIRDKPSRLARPSPANPPRLRPTDPSTRSLRSLAQGDEVVRAAPSLAQGDEVVGAAGPLAQGDTREGAPPRSLRVTATGTSPPPFPMSCPVCEVPEGDRVLETARVIGFFDRYPAGSGALLSRVLSSAACGSWSGRPPKSALSSHPSTRGSE